MNEKNLSQMRNIFQLSFGANNVILCIFLVGYMLHSDTITRPNFVWVKQKKNSKNPLRK